MLLVSLDDFLVRPFQSGDEGFLYELSESTLKPYFAHTSEGWSRKTFFRKLNPSRIGVLCDNYAQIGFYDAKMLEKELYIHNLQLSASFQGKGLGSKIITGLKVIGGSEDVSYLKAKVFAERTDVISWLEGLSWVKEEVIPEENSYWMRCYL